MSRARRAVEQWFDQGLLSSETLPQALRLAGVTPAPADWRRFFDLLLLWCGAVAGATGVVFFFAYNWQSLDRMMKFALVELALVGAVGVYLLLDRRGSRSAAQATLFAAALLVGALLALVGQTYQTGADPWQLFAVWALMILPWAALDRSAPLWLLWLALLNLSVVLYFDVHPFWFDDDPFTTQQLLLTALNSAALLAVELGYAYGLRWLRSRWLARLLLPAALLPLTLLTVWTVGAERPGAALSLAIFAVWVAAAVTVYRYRLLDLFMLAMLVCALLAVAIALQTRLLSSLGSGGLLLISLSTIALTGAASAWLRRLARSANGGPADV